MNTKVWSKFIRVTIEFIVLAIKRTQLSLVDNWSLLSEEIYILGLSGNTQELFCHPTKSWDEK